jgi:DNA-binding transcriptional MerR regulator
MEGYPIRVIAELTGVPAATLRAWERRYGLLKPRRTPKGHRVYDARDLETVRSVVRLLDQNHPISRAADMVARGVGPEDGGDEESPWAGLRRRLLRAVEAFDEGRLDALYNEALSLYPVDLVSVNLLHPVLEVLGERWQGRERGIAEEHFFTAYLRNKIGARMHHAGGGHGRRLLLACLPGERHELGLLLFSLSLLARGYRVLYLGPDLPLEQVRAVAEAVHPAGVLLSGSAAGAGGVETGALKAAARALDVPVMIGGGASDRDPEAWRAAGVTPLGSDYAGALERLAGLVPAYARP